MNSRRNQEIAAAIHGQVPTSLLVLSTVAGVQAKLAYELGVYRPYCTAKTRVPIDPCLVSYHAVWLTSTLLCRPFGPQKGICLDSVCLEGFIVAAAASQPPNYW